MGKFRLNTPAEQLSIKYEVTTEFSYRRKKVGGDDWQDYIA